MTVSAFLEFGSTSIKFYLLETGQRAGRIQREVKIPWDLGLEVFQGRAISQGTISSCLSSLEKLERRFPHVQLRGAIAVGTAALREARNAEEFRSALRQRFGLRFHVIEGGLEAYVLESGFRDAIESYPTVVFDLGGGSVELVEFSSPTRTSKTSLPFGAVRLHCQLSGIDDMGAYVRKGREILEAGIQPRLEPVPSDEIVGTGGTVRAVARLLGKKRFDLGDIVLFLRPENSVRLSGLEPHRRRILVPGVLIIERLLKALGPRRVVYKEATIKDAALDLLSDPAAEHTPAHCG